jgi:hypothetical protein
MKVTRKLIMTPMGRGKETYNPFILEFMNYCPTRFTKGITYSL